MEFTNFYELIDQVNSVVKQAHLGKNSKEFIPRYQINKFLELLSPDSDNYFCTLNPVFSLELEYEEEIIKKVKVFSFRDGVMPLLKFFTFNSEPMEKDIIIIVDSELSSLVPPSWRSRVLLRSLQTQKKVTTKKRNSEKIFIISPFSESIPLDILEIELERLAKVIMDENIYCFFSSAKLRGAGQSQRDELWGYKILMEINKKFKSNKLQILNWNELASIDVSDMEYYDFNSLKYYFSDSFLVHDLGQRGAVPIFSKESKTLESPLMHLCKISVHHGFNLHQNFDAFNSFGSEKLIHQIDELQLTRDGKIEKLRGNLICSPEFKSWSYDVARSIYFANIK